LLAATTLTPTQPAAATPITTIASPPIASSQRASSGIDPSAASLALSLSQIPAAPAAISSPTLLLAPAPLLAPALTSNLPTADASQSGHAAEAASDRVFADLDAGVSLALLVDDLALVGGSSEDLTPASRRQ
jgi:hypothetical protein